LSLSWWASLAEAFSDFSPLTHSLILPGLHQGAQSLITGLIILNVDRGFLTVLKTETISFHFIAEHRGCQLNSRPAITKRSRFPSVSWGEKKVGEGGSLSSQSPASFHLSGCHSLSPGSSWEWEWRTHILDIPKAKETDCNTSEQ
jgi:hypothetical protein